MSLSFDCRVSRTDTDLAVPNRSVTLSRLPDRTRHPEFPIDSMADSEIVRRLALELANTQEKPCYGTPGFYVKRTLFARLLPDGDSVVVKIDQGDRARRMGADPNTFFTTAHYRNYPMMIVRLSTVEDADLRELLSNAWELAAS